MRKIGILIAACAALGAAPAFAADLIPLKAPPPPPPPPVFSWTGFYIGAQGGAGWGASSATENDFYFCAAGGACDPTTPVIPGIPMSNVSTHGAFGGVTAGYNYQINHVVLGIEGDWSGANINGSSACSTAFVVAAFGGTSGTCGSDLRDFGTVTGRFGLAWDRALLYVKGGGAWARFNDTVTTTVLGIPGPAANFTSDRSGYTIGAGLEYAFAPGWSAKVEYDHMEFGTQNVTYPFVNTPPFATGIFNTIDSESQRVDIVRVGLNYRFNFGGPRGPQY